VRLLLPLLLLLPSLTFAADVKPSATTLNNKCKSWAMCVAQGSTGVCVDASNDVIVHTVGRVATYTFYSTTSTASDYICNIMTNKTGYTSSVDNSTATDQVNTASITDEAPVYTMHVQLHKLWITCPTLANNVVNINVDICPRD
jgi:hypothetical protein